MWTVAFFESDKSLRVRENGALYDGSKIVPGERRGGGGEREIGYFTNSIRCNYGRPLVSFRIDRLAARFPAR